MSSSDKGQEAGRAARGHKTSRPTLKAEAGAGHSPKAGTAINDVARPPGRPFPNVVFLTKVSANDDQVRTYGDATKRRLQSRHPTETLSGPRSGQTHRSKPLKPARGATQPLARPAQGKGPANVRKRIDHPTVGLDRYFYGKLSIKQNSQIKKTRLVSASESPKMRDLRTQGESQWLDPGAGMRFYVANFVVYQTTFAKRNRPNTEEGLRQPTLRRVKRNFLHSPNPNPNPPHGNGYHPPIDSP